MLSVTAQVCFGSVGEVRRFEEYLYGNSPRFSTANELEVRGFCAGGREKEGGWGVGWSCLVSLAHTHNSVSTSLCVNCVTAIPNAWRLLQPTHRLMCADLWVLMLLDWVQAAWQALLCVTRLLTVLRFGVLPLVLQANPRQ